MRKVLSRILLFSFSSLMVLICFGQGCSKGGFDMNDPLTSSDHSSTSGSPPVSDGTPITTPTQLDFDRFQTIVKTNCYACHETFKQYTTEVQWKTLSGQLLVPGFPEKSKIYTRLTLSTLGTDTKSMPPATASPQISKADADFIREYIKLLPPETSPANTAANYALDSLKVACNVVGESQAYHTLKLLSDFELKNTLKDIFTSTFFNVLFEVSIDPATQTESSSLDAVPKRRIQESLTAPFLFSKGATTVTAEFLKTYDTTIWNAVQKMKTLSVAQRTQFFTSYVACYNEAALTDDCVSQFISAFGLSAYRRKILTTEVNQFKASVANESTPLNKLYYIIYGMLMAPDFIYHYEVNGTNANNMLVLDQYALASRISYLVTGSTPDKKMLQLATDGKISTAVDISSAVDYLVATYPTKVKENIWQFTSEWLRLTSSNFPNSPRANAISNSFINLAGGEGSTFRKAALQEMKDMFGYYTVDKPGTFTDLLTSDKSFASNAKLAQVYNTPMWSAGQTPPVIPTTEKRVGFLTKAAMTIHGGDRNNPFATGGTIFKHVLCRQFGSPGGIFTPAVIDNTVVRTTRQYYEAIVPRGSSCIGCHSQIEPFGMPYEQFDIFSRNRNNIEKIYDDNGTYLGDRPTDTTQSATFGTVAASVDNALSLVNKINDSKEAHVCFATQIYRNHFGRISTSADACMLSRIADKASSNGSVIDILKALAIDASFRQRRMN
ncbi:DUF1592 domain-containing protein [Bdellovibrio sp. HCB337]|uniref:DUF1592 domain-containing protein n=1 Tax=Bdellovibrio sp. HCB337 TaxID=3394358 RepID=UPI0039A60E6F